MTPLLACKDLTIAYAGRPTVSGIDLAMAAGECLALVGASGSGKSTIAQAVLGLHHPSTRVTGRLSLLGRDLLNGTEADFARLRGSLVGYVAQDPYAACDPLRPVGHHVAEAWRSQGMTPAPGSITGRLSAVGIENAGQLARKAPHCWSGGMLQRACIAAASAHAPPLLVADEPTSALDADRADGVLAALRAGGSAILLISHDLNLVRRHADRVAILHEGRLVEVFPVKALGERSRHPATRRLAAPPPAVAATAPQAPGRALVMAHGIARTYAGTQRTIGPISFQVRAGDCIGLTGPSGSGKSTLLRLIAGLETADAGRIERTADLCRPGAVMPVFQNPAASLNPYWPIWRTISEPAAARTRIARPDRKALARRLLTRVGLAEADLDARPAEFSLGQCQRIAIARAVAANPMLLIADEPTSALDTVSRAAVTDLFAALVREGMALVLASHDPWVHQRLDAEVVQVG